MNHVFLFLALCFTSIAAFGQEFPEVDKSPMDMAYYPANAPFKFFAKTEAEKEAAVAKIRVIYSRPMKNDRDIFGGLEKFGSVWRVGANESTEIQFFEDVMIGDAKVSAGRYSIYAIINEADWEIKFNTALDGWGHYAYDEKMDVASIKVPTEKSDKTIEAFSILFEKSDDGAHMIMGWDDTIVRVPISL